MADYYVRSDADAGGNGTTTDTTGANCAWNSIAQINAKAFASGDVVHFRPGDTFDDATFTLAGVSSAISGLTIQSSDFGGKTVAIDGLPWLDHDNMRTWIQNSNISDLTFKNLNMSGLGDVTVKQMNLRFSSIAGVVVDGIYMNGDYGTPRANNVGQNGVVIEANCSGTIEIKNCDIFNLGPTDASGVLTIPLQNGTDSLGIVVYGMASAAVTIHDNTVYNCNADCIQLFKNAPTNTMQTYVYDNVLYNAGEDIIDVKGFSNVEIYQNEFYRESFTGSGGSGGGPYAIIIHESGALSVTHENIIIRDNTFYDFPHITIDIWTTSSEPHTEIQCRNNTFNACGSAFFIGSYISNLIINYNFINNPVGTNVVYVNSASSTSRQIINNTIIYGTGSATRAFYLETPVAETIRNNVIKWNYVGTIMYVNTTGTAPTVDNNIWYNAGSTDKISWRGTTYNEANWATWEASHDNDSYADPKVLSTGILESDSPALNAGIIVAGVNDIGKLDIWDNSSNNTPNIGADQGSEQNFASIETGFNFKESSYIVRVRQ